jgi:4-hydroxy-2-oxoheptanedioate aldolase
MAASDGLTAHIAGRNQVKAKLKAGEPVFGTWSVCSSPTVVNVIASTGLDFVTIDMEHGPTSFETAEQMLYAIEAGGSTPMIRLGEGSEPTILRAVDIGSRGILVSHVSSAETTAEVVRATKYQPLGTRGLSPFIRQHQYSEDGLVEKLARANEEMLVGVLVEGEDAIDDLERIASTPELDVIYLGMYDLSQAVGVPGRLDDDRVIRLAHRCVETIEAHNLAAGAVARDREHLEFLLSAGFRYLSYLVDTAIIREGFVAARESYEQLLRSVG